MASFQVGAAFAKDLFPALGPEGAATLRLGFGALMLLALGRPWRTRPRRAPLLPMLGLGLSMAGVIVMFYQAIDHLPLGVAIALQFLGPLAIALAGSRRAIDLVWAAAAAGGVWLLVGVGIPAAPLDPVGIAWGLGAGVCWGAYILCGQAATQTFGASTAALSVTVAALIMLPVGVAHAGAALLSPALLPLALVVALFSTAIPFSFELFAMPRLPAQTFAVLMSVEPAFGVLSGFALLHERLALGQIVGVGLVIAGSAGAAWFGPRKTTAASDAANVAPPT
jgi:inner membrane transporter RhtA